MKEIKETNDYGDLLPEDAKIIREALRLYEATCIICNQTENANYAGMLIVNLKVVEENYPEIID